ncbi:hypothetical protein PENARI_c002G08950 [Penicillium arizonense]|uniref:Membrane insertase YidC/Oxa/ALB C-terminal domain-containing protein n=1 Tax=Penicillium arizonense TaxID=1835702 RepID=A0A1F5LVG2_PENAI|nr:hypothetical protein PENARI_c002G08950 [Penicillium arizonense]OGE57148.1 hypothetical protein PENARI_c002G08950 [Penicillium arizonense]
MGPVGLKGPNVTAAFARQRVAAMSRSTRSISTFRSQSLRFPANRGQFKSALSGNAPWRMAPAAIGPAAIRFNSTSSNQPPTEIADKATNSEWSNTSDLFDITTIPERIGYLKELGLDYGWGPSSMIQWLIEHVHIWTGMPWWASIVAAGVITRLLLLKPVMDAASMGAKMRNVKEETDPIRTRMVEGTRNGNQQDAQMARAELSEIHKREGIVAWKSFVPMAQIPLGYGTFRVVRGMTSLPVPAVASESVAWINDLTIADPTYLLPVMSAAMLMVVLKKGGEAGTMPVLNSSAGKALIYGLPTVSFVFMAFMPSALQLYFVVTGAWGLGQTYLINSEKFRQWMDMTMVNKTDAGMKHLSNLTKNTHSKGLRLLMERIELEKAEREKARAQGFHLPEKDNGDRAPGKVSLVDRWVANAKEAGKGMAKDIQEKLNTSPTKQTGRLTAEEQKRAMEYETQRSVEEKAIRDERNQARRKEHITRLRDEMTKAKDSSKRN